MKKAWLSVAISLVLVGVLGWFTREPRLDPAEAAALAGHYRFQALPYPELAGVPRKAQRQVHPSLRRISAWISAFGAGVALADLDGDGLANDTCLNDPRYDAVRIAPAPGTEARPAASTGAHPKTPSAAAAEARYAPFLLPTPSEGYAPATLAPMGCLPADLNEDGLMDLVVYYWGRTPVAYLRQGGVDLAGGTKNTTGGNRALPAPLSAASYRVQPLIPGAERWYSNSGTAADLDGDGHLDLLFANYFPEGGHLLDAQGTGREQIQDSNAASYIGGSKFVLRFTSAEAGAAPAVRYRIEQPLAAQGPVAHGWTLAVGAADLDGDGLPEVYLANDFGPDRLLHNRSTPGHLEFVTVEGERTLTTPKSFVLGRDSFKGMGVEFADVDGNGHLDIHVSNIANKYGLMESHLLWLHTGDTAAFAAGRAPYVQGSERYNVSRSSWGWDARFLDLDLDGGLELLQATGFVQGKINRWPEMQAVATTNERIMSNPELWPRIKEQDDVSGHQRKGFFVLGADGRYHDIAGAIGWTETTVSRGIATADVDGDGRMDFAFAHQWSPSIFYRNQSPPRGGFLGLHLLRCPGNHPEAVTATPGHPAPGLAARHCTPAIGAAVAVVAPGGRLLVAQVDGGSGHSGKKSPDLHFGLGELPAAADPANPAALEVQMRWRDAQGQRWEGQIRLPPGWHTVELGK
jgi:hypothetical protein